MKMHHESSKKLTIIGTDHTLKTTSTIKKLLQKHNKALILLEFHMQQINDPLHAKKDDCNTIFHFCKAHHIKVVCIDEAAPRLISQYIKKASIFELVRLRLHSMLGITLGRKQLKRKFPIFYDYLLKKRESAMISIIRSRLKKKQETIIIIGTIHFKAIKKELAELNA